MKTSKRIFALLMTLAMLLSLAPAPAFASNEAGAMSAVTADLVTDAASFNDVSGLITTTATASTAAGRTFTAETVQIPLEPDDIAGDTLKITVTGGSAVKVYKYTATTEPAQNGDAVDGGTDVTSAITGAGQSVAYGDVYYVLDGDSASTQSIALKVAKFIIVTSESGKIGGTATKKSPVYNVKVPTTLAFAIDPLQIGDIALDTDQISSGTFAFGNGSNVPVKVTVDLTASGPVAANLQPGDWTPTETKVGADKDAKLALLGAVSTTGSPTLVDPANGTQDYTQSAGVDTLRWFDPASKKSSVEFLLAQGNGTALGGTAKDGVGIFRVYAQLETYATWGAGDIVLNGTYTLSGVKTTDYAAPFGVIGDAGANKADDPATKADETTISDSDSNDDWPAWNGGFKGTAARSAAIEAVGLNVLPGESATTTTYGFLPGPGVSNINNAAKTATYTFTHGTMAAGATIPFAFDSKTATKIEYPVGTTLSGSWANQTVDGFALNPTSFNTLAANTYVMRIIVGGDNWDITFVVQ